MRKKDFTGEGRGARAYLRTYRYAGESIKQFSKFIGKNERDEPGARLQYVMTELACQPITDIRTTKRWHGQAAGGYYQLVANIVTLGGFQVKGIRFYHVRYVAVSFNDCTGLLAFGAEQGDNVLRGMVTKQLPVSFFVVGDVMLFNQGNKIMLRIARQCRFAEMGIDRKVIGGIDLEIGEVTAPATRHQYFLADLVRTFEHHYLAAPFSCGNCTHQPGGTRTDHNDIVLVQSDSSVPVSVRAY